MATVPEQIFKAYDVRGLYGDDIDEDIAEQLGRAFVRVLAELGYQVDLLVAPDYAGSVKLWEGAPEIRRRLVGSPVCQQHPG